MSANTNPSLLSFRRFSPARSRLPFVGCCFAVSVFCAGCPERFDPYDGLAWSSARHNEGMALLYGPPDSEVTFIRFFCRHGSGAVTTSIPWGGAQVSDIGIPLSISLSSQNGRVELRRITRPPEDGDMPVRAEGLSPESLSDLLKAGEILTVESNGATEVFPLENVDVPADAFLTFCTSD